MPISERISYRDAVKIMTGESENLRKTLENLLGGAIIISSFAVGPAALSALGVKNEVAKWGQDRVEGLAGRLSGFSEKDRTLNAQAAHAVLVVCSLIEAANDLWNWKKLGVTDKELISWLEDSSTRPEPANKLVQVLLQTRLPFPSPQSSFTDTVAQVENFASEYLSSMREALRAYVPREKYEELDKHLRSSNFSDDVAVRYISHYQRLSGDVPEFRVWCSIRESKGLRATTAEIERALTELTHSIGNVEDSGSLNVLSQKLDEISAAVSWRTGDQHQKLQDYYLAQIGKPAVDISNQLPTDLTLPTKADIYQSPEYRLIEQRGGSILGADSLWGEETIRRDIGEFLASYLTSPRAMSFPLLVLGQPGAGKTLFTEILSARLSTSTFTAVRVVLRQLPANADPALQMKQALAEALNDEVSYAQFVESTSTLPVVIFDGFDELVQASGVTHSDYLEKVAKLQEDEADRGRPLIAIVTSRISVVDRARVPTGSLVLRLEPLTSDQISNWVGVWNTSLGPGLRRNDLDQLDSVVVLRHYDLAQQPILLLMLALYDASDNDLANLGDGLGTANLYEALLQRFVLREVMKEYPGADRKELDRRVEFELLELSVAAYGMFNRGQRFLSQAELQHDLDSLALNSVNSGPHESLSTPVRQAEKVIGQFFFIHTASAAEAGERFDPERIQYEFLHSTFGEYLIARLLFDLLTAVKTVLPSKVAWQSETTIWDDGLLFSLLGLASLAGQVPTMSFFSQIVERRSDDRRLVHEACVNLLREDEHPSFNSTHYSYNPLGEPTVRRYSFYGSNLALLLGASNGEVDVAVIAPYANTATYWWRGLAGLWRSQLSEYEWEDLSRILSPMPGDQTRMRFSYSLEGAQAPAQGPAILSQLVDDPQPSPGQEWTPVISGNVFDLSSRVNSTAALTFDYDLRFCCDILHVIYESLGAAAADQVLFRRASVGADIVQTHGLFNNSIPSSIVFSHICFHELCITREDPDYLHYIHETAARLLENSSTTSCVTYLRQLYLSADCVSESVLSTLVQSFLDRGPGNKSFTFYAWLLSIAVSGYARTGSPNLLNAAMDAFQRLDLSDEVDRYPTEVLCLLLRVEGSGMNVSALDDSRPLDLVDWLNRLNLRVVQEVDRAVLVQALRMVRQRARQDFFALRFDLASYALDELVDSETLDLFLACQVLVEEITPDMADAPSIAELKAVVRDLPEYGEDLLSTLRSAVRYTKLEDELFLRATRTLLKNVGW